MVWRLFSKFRNSLVKEKQGLDKEKQKIFQERKDFVRGFIVFVVGYGLILNFAIWQIFHLPFTWISWIAWGFAFWFIREELPIIIRRILDKK